jgi:two-component system cell cycle response regulator CtrA
MRALLIDDAPASDNIASMLRDAGIQLDEARSDEDPAGLARHFEFDVIFLHLRSPTGSFAALRLLRAAAIQAPVLVLSGPAPLQTKLSAFSAGADDFIVKPFEKAELRVRAQAAVRRTRGFSSAVLRVGPLSLNLDTREATVSGRTVRLTRKQYAVLELLTLRKGMSVTKQTLMDHLYGGLDEPEPKIIDVFVCKLRKVLREVGAPDLIGTVWGRGYILRDGANAIADAGDSVGGLVEAGHMSAKQLSRGLGAARQNGSC